MYLPYFGVQNAVMYVFSINYCNNLVLPRMLHFAEEESEHQRSSLH